MKKVLLFEDAPCDQADLWHTQRQRDYLKVLLAPRKGHRSDSITTSTDGHVTARAGRKQRNVREVSMELILCVLKTER